jgi:osmoprotectant transport system ATP-binding protein
MAPSSREGLADPSVIADVQHEPAKSAEPALTGAPSVPGLFLDCLALRRFMIELDGVSKRFGETQAVQDVSLRAAGSETTVLIGPSGCGKSTLLRLMIGLIQPDAGDIRVGGEALPGGAELRAARHRMGYVIQEGGLFPHLTGRGNVALLPRHLGWGEARITERLRELAELVQLPEKHLESYPPQLSGGQRQRVSLMRALVLDPDVLLLDEPLGALDPLIRADLQEDLRSIFRRLDKTVVLVTHDMSEAGYFGDRIVLMRRGGVVQTGAFRTLVDEPADDFVERFVNAQRSLLAEA